MDANLQRPYLLADRTHFRLDGGGAGGLVYDKGRRLLRLATARQRTFTEAPAAAQAALDRVPGAIDRFTTRAAWDGAHVVASGALPGVTPLALPGPPAAVTDLALGFDDVLYVAGDGRVLLVDLRGRWDAVSVTIAPGFAAWRLAAAPDGGVWAIDRATGALARVSGLPMRPRRASYAAAVFRPVPEDPDPPRARVLAGVSLPAGETAAAIATSPAGRLAVLSWSAGAPARLRLLEGTPGHESLGAPVLLDGVQSPFSVSWVSEQQVAVLLATAASAPLREALVYTVDADPDLGAAVDGPRTAEPTGDLYPLRDHDGGPFLHATSAPPFYTTNAGEALPLHRISWPAFAESGVARSALLLDGGTPRAIWHRLYLEAAIPDACGVRVSLATTDIAAEPDDDADWHEHDFGLVPVSDPSTSSSPAASIPRGTWLARRSEIPFHPGLLPCASRPGESGLFTALIQRPDRRVRSLSGRYLWVRLELLGDGRSTPEVAALRVYASRRSYAAYLPSLYRESLLGPEGDDAGESTRADFLERFLGVFEGMLTPLEDQIRASYLLTDPRTTPVEALDWLASWIGFALTSGVPAERQRAMLERAPDLYRQRGTLAGYELALDLATGGAVDRGEVLVLEDFRLRRAFATILGADLADEEDPLLPGLATSGNSLVGDTLFLGDDLTAEFLALFGPEAAVSRRDQRAVAALFERLAHRATVLVHDEMADQDLGIIRAVAGREAPAHLEIKVLTASQRLMVGVSSLVGVDTFLANKPPVQPLRVDVSEVGARDVVQHLPSLDPRLGRAP